MPSPINPPHKEDSRSNPDTWNETIIERPALSETVFSAGREQLKSEFQEFIESKLSLKALQFLGGSQDFSFLVQDDKGTPFVVKFFDARSRYLLEVDPNSDLDLFRELEVHRMLKGDHFPKVFDYGYAPKLHAVYMRREYYAGPSLGDQLFEGKALNSEQALDIMIQLVEGLQSLHGKRIDRNGEEKRFVHADIKPQNIILISTNPIKAKLIDLGVARIVKTGRTIHPTMSIGGTAEYMPNEQIRGDAEAASDFYSLGVTMVQSLLGAEAVPRGLAEQTMGENYIIPRDRSINPYLRGLLQRMIEPDIRIRRKSVPSADALLDELVKLKEGRHGIVAPLMQKVSYYFDSERRLAEQKYLRALRAAQTHKRDFGILMTSYSEFYQSRESLPPLAKVQEVFREAFTHLENRLTRKLGNRTSGSFLPLMDEARSLARLIRWYPVEHMDEASRQEFSGLLRESLKQCEEYTDALRIGVSRREQRAIPFAAIIRELYLQFHIKQQELGEDDAPSSQFLRAHLKPLFHDIENYLEEIKQEALRSRRLGIYVNLDFATRQQVDFHHRIIQTLIPEDGLKGLSDKKVIELDGVQPSREMGHESLFSLNDRIGLK